MHFDPPCGAPPKEVLPVTYMGLRQTLVKWLHDIQCQASDIATEIHQGEMEDCAAQWCVTQPRHQVKLEWKLLGGWVRQAPKVS